MAWDPTTNPVDYILLEGHVSPGIAEVHGADSPRRIIERQGYGLSGAANYYGGRKLSHFGVTLRLYTSDHWAHWYTWKPLVDPPPYGRRAKAKQIWHPYLVDLGIKAVLVENCSQPKQMDDGHWEVEVNFAESRKLRLDLQKAEGTAEPTAQTEPEREMIRLQGQIDALSGPAPQATGWIGNLIGGS